MRFLKTKIAYSQQARKENGPSRKEEQFTSSQNTLVNEKIVELSTQPKKRKRIPGCPVTTPTDRATKNIVKNYGKAICSFASSKVGEPYLQQITHKYNVSISEFVNFVLNAKENIESMSSFRNLLLVHAEDDEQTSKLKKVFAAVSEVFIKYFSVNWIFSGRLTYKEIHLKFRFKLLRRIQNPESFTYLSLRAKKELL